MNRYPWWKYFLLVFALLVGALFTAPNFFGEAPAVQISSAKPTLKINAAMQAQVSQVLADAGLATDIVQFEGNSIKARFADTDTQFKAKDALSQALNPDEKNPSYVVALNLVSRSPRWLTALHALPMYLGLDLRGGVHFLMQVDMKAALATRADALLNDMRSTLKDKKKIYPNLSREGDQLVARFQNQADFNTARRLLTDEFNDLSFAATSPVGADSTEFKLVGTFKPEAAQTIQEAALKQNITTLHNRVNELGVAEPVIQQQGLDRVIVQLPGVQDTAKAKEIIRRTATLQVRLVDESTEAKAALAGQAPLPAGTERHVDRSGQPLILQRRVVFTGENLIDARTSRNQKDNQPNVDLEIDSKASRVFAAVTRENKGKRMAILLFEKGQGEIVTAPTINDEINGGRFFITGSRSDEEAQDTALLLRSGSLAAPMEIIEEKTIGPSMGAENIAKGFNSVMYGFAAIAVFMLIYYRLFGVFSTVALAVNLLLLVAVLSMVQATLSLPGMAAIALTLGMAIDANVLINERVREELRAGASPQSAIAAGYERAFATILDSNVTTFIAGIALYAFGSGPVKGFALVHCVGILTSMFSAVFFSRGLVNLWYGQQRKLKKISIGQIWRPEGQAVASGSPAGMSALAPGG
jgi:preprotein translocase subunit SecD